MFKILKTYHVCDLRIDQAQTRFGEEMWFLIDEGQECELTGLGTILVQGTRAEVAARVRVEMGK